MMRALRPLPGDGAFGRRGGRRLPPAQEEAPTPPAQHWSFDGPFGSLDLAAAQRGFQVYSEICAVCHSLQYLHYRDLTGIGLTEDQIKAIAAAITVPQGVDDQGNPKEGPATPADQFKSPVPERAGGASRPQRRAAARSVADRQRPRRARRLRLCGAYGVRRSATWHADAGGDELQQYFPGHQIAMPPPLHDGQVTYADGTSASVEQMAHDVVTFLYWAANPEMVQRKQIGWRWVLFFLIMAGLTYAVKRKVWADVH